MLIFDWQRIDWPIVSGAQRDCKLSHIICYHNLQSRPWQWHAQKHCHSDKSIGNDKKRSADSTENCQRTLRVDSTSQRTPQHDGNQNTIDGYAHSENLIQMLVHVNDNCNGQWSKLVLESFPWWSLLTKCHGYKEAKAEQPFAWMPTEGVNIEYMRHAKGDHSKRK